jgi:hypothetical protein
MWLVGRIVERKRTRHLSLETSWSSRWLWSTLAEPVTISTFASKSGSSVRSAVNATASEVREPE